MMKKSQKLLCLLLSAMLAATMMTGCGSSGSSSAGNSGDTAAAAEADNKDSAGEDAAEAQPTGAEKESTIKVGVSGTPLVDPALANANSDLIAMVNIYDTLVYPDSSSESGVVGRVADSWDVSEDGLTYTFHLKQGIKFHNGDELTASDVVYSMDRYLTIGEGYSYIFDDCMEPGGTEATDDYTVVFHLTNTYGPFLNALVRLAILNEEQVVANTDTSVDTYGENGDYGKTWLIDHDAGSGAYKAVTLVQQDYFYAEKNDDWFMGWDNEYAPEAFKLMSIQEAATVRTMVNNRELDITDTWQSTETLNALSQIDGVSLARVSNTLAYSMYFNNQIAPLDDVNFRRAINALIDKDTICEQILIDSEPIASPIPSGMNGAAEGTSIEYNIEKAKEYIAASKYADNYQDYPIEFVVNSDVSDLEKIALLLQSAAQQVGITIEISKAPWVSLIDRMGSMETSPQITMINYSAGVNDAGVCIQSRYSKATQGTWNNGEWLDDDYLESALSTALTTVDDASRNEQYAEIQRYLVDDICVSGFVCDLAERCAYQSAYVNWRFVEDAPTGAIPTAVNGYTQVYADIEYHLENK